MNYLPGTNLMTVLKELAEAKMLEFTSYVLPFGAELERQLFDRGFSVSTVLVTNGIASSEYFTLVNLDV